MRPDMEAMSSALGSHGAYPTLVSGCIKSWRTHCFQAISDAAALVSGPSLMALAHLARRDGPAREAIAEASAGSNIRMLGNK